MHPNPQPGGSPELGGNQVPRARGEDIVMVKAGGGTGFEQLSHAGQGGPGHHLLVQPLPHLVEGHQPGKQLHPLHLGQVAGKNLVKMMMGVD
ncbi:hypothetical protein SDC9_92102 [bioreactor metagenome]|uniref:Uncharacterized protein n=1 Tax=bioreactor metagenome TaxID=1076179 RepID=A0A644ZWV4_9ZZZZ